MLSTPLVYLVGFGVLFIVLGLVFWAMVARRSQKETARGMVIVGVFLVVISVFLAILPIPGLNG